MLHLNNVEQIFFTARLPSTCNIAQEQVGDIVSISHVWITQPIFMGSPGGGGGWGIQEFPTSKQKTRAQKT